MSVIARKLLKSATTAAATGDPYWNQVSLLVNAENNLAFRDESSNNFAITKTGTVTPNLTTPFSSGAGGSIKFNGTTDYLSYTSTAIGTSIFTMELWVYVPQIAVGGAFIDTRSPDTIDNAYNFYMGNGGAIAFGCAFHNYIVSASSLVVNTWTHVALVRTSATAYSIYLNGVLNTSATSAFTLNNTITAAKIGNGLNGYFSGYMSNFRIVIGTALYTANFTPSTTPLTAIANTSLLITGTGQGMYDNSVFVDQSPIGSVITATGAPLYSGLSPFTNYPGSIQLSSSAAVVAASNAIFGLPGTFTLEFWVKFNAAMVSGNLMGMQTTNGFNIYWDSTTSSLNPNIYGGGNIFASTYNPNNSLNVWTHIAVTRNASNLMTMWVDGVSVGSATTTTTYATGAWTIGSSVTNVNISNLRIVSGTALYIAAFTPPTVPLAAISGTSLLIRGDTGAFYDQSSDYGVLVAANNNLFYKDSSTNNFTVTKTGTVTPNLTTPVTGGGSLSFKGTGNRLAVPAGSAFAYGTNPFTVEAWINPYTYQVGATYMGGIIFCQTVSGTNYFLLSLVNGTAGLIFGTGGGTSIVSAAGSVPLNVWTHVAVVREGIGTNQTKVYINGTLSTTSTCAYNFTDTTYVPSIGNYTHDLTQTPFGGFISNLRVVNGTAVYTANFTPSTTPLTAIANTSLLITGTNQGQPNDTTFVDQGPNALTITGTGSPTYSYLNPFVGKTGSISLSGTSQYISAPASALFAFGTGDFTVECWIYPTAAAFGRITNRQPAQGLAGTWGFNFSSVTFTFTEVIAGEPGPVASGLPTMLNTWTHLVASRQGTTLRLFANGALVGSGTNSTNFSNSSYALGIGAAYETFFPGYISNVRIVKGTAVYTSAFIPPTTPLLPITNTSLLIRGDTGYLYGQTLSGGLAITKTGTPTVSTQQKKFGNESYYFNGSTDYLTSPDNTAFNMGSSNFTIEAWVYLTSTPTGTATIINKDGKNAISWPQYALSVNASRQVYVVLSTTTASAPAGSPTTSITGTTVLTLNTWYHVALTRIGVNATLWVNGISNGTTASALATFNTRSGLLYIGFEDSQAASSCFPGYIDDLRITKGVARYTANFTPPATTYLIGA